MSTSLLLAFALMLILEGILPFLWPRKWRVVFSELLKLGDGQIRFIGLSSMMIGLLLLVVFK